MRENVGPRKHEQLKNKDQTLATTEAALGYYDNLNGKRSYHELFPHFKDYTSYENNVSSEFSAASNTLKGLGVEVHQFSGFEDKHFYAPIVTKPGAFSTALAELTSSRQELSETTKQGLLASVETILAAAPHVIAKTKQEDCSRYIDVAGDTPCMQTMQHAPTEFDQKVWASLHELKTFGVQLATQLDRITGDTQHTTTEKLRLLSIAYREDQLLEYAIAAQIGVIPNKKGEVTELTEKQLGALSELLYTPIIEPSYIQEYLHDRARQIITAYHPNTPQKEEVYVDIIEAIEFMSAYKNNWR